MDPEGRQQKPFSVRHLYTGFHIDMSDLILSGKGFLLLLIGLCCSCTASRDITRTQQYLRGVEDYRIVDIDATSEELSGYRKDDEDEVLYYLEQGMLNHYRENWTQSSESFHRAERAIEQNYTKSINENLQSLLINDLQLAYRGEAYEDIYLNVVKALNFLQQHQVGSALVEARRVTHKLERLSDRYKGLAESLSRDTAQVAVQQADEELEEVDLLEEDEEGPADIQQNSALGRFLTTVLYAKEGAADDARIEFTQLKTALEDQGQIGFLSAFEKDSSASSPSEVSVPPPDRFTHPEAFNTLFLAFGGQAPRKEERSYRIPILVDGEDVYLDFAVPVLKPMPTEVDRVRAVVAGETLNVPLLEDMQSVAQTMFEEKKSIVYTRAVIRAFLKAGATEGASAKAEEEAGWLAGQVADQAGQLMSYRAAQADTRGWQTMPGYAYASVAKLPSGEHEVTFEFLSEEGSVLKKRTRRVNVGGAQDLALVESIYLK